MNIESLKEWFQKRPVWLQEAAKRLIEKEVLKDEDYTELYKYCLDESKKRPASNGEVLIPIKQLSNETQPDGIIRLKSIGNIKGINILSPKNPLNFGEKNLVVIYGLNRSGKSGYVRILKHICGTKPRLPLLQNIYNPPESEQKCTIEYQKGSEPKKREWSVSEKKPIDDLDCVDIFDSECAMSYIRDENEVAYEPKILSFFSDLVKICEKISFKIQSDIDNRPSKKPSCPPEYKMTKGGKWYNEKLSPDTTEEYLNSYCSWTEDNKKELAGLQKRLTQEAPEKKAKEIREKNKHLKELIDRTTHFLESLSDQKHVEINKLKEEYVQAKETAKVAADQTFEKSPLKGVGSETWKQLWHYAKEYSEKEAYKGQSFPVLSDDALCVLCQQKLDEDAKSRFDSFKNFVRGEAQRAVESIEKSLESIRQSLPDLPNQTVLKTQLDAAEIQSDDTPLRKLYDELEKRKNQFIGADIQPNLIPLPSFEKWKSEAEKRIEERECEAKQYDEDEKGINRDSLLAKQKELQMREWLSQQINAIKKEIERLKYIKILNSAKRLTDTTAISKQKGKLSEELITENFAKRFNTELEELKANKIKVEIFKSRTEKAKALHQIRLKNTKSQDIKTWNILSEGETRIVALSAFLADVTGGEYSSPFVFDDPISSLDQDFEEAVAKRLVQLSKKRQVIVFTHRLSMLGLIEEAAKKNDIEPDISSVKEEHWGTGEPGDIPLFAKKPDKALNVLIKKLLEAKTLLKNRGKDSYEDTAKSLISDFRIIIENVIESVLLKDIVKRHRRQIHTTKVKELAKINKDDLKLVDDLMTKYSSFLHSQPEETTANLPDPEQLKEDFTSLKGWIKKFNKK